MIPGAAGCEGHQPIVRQGQVKQTLPDESLFQGHAPTVHNSTPIENLDALDVALKDANT